MDTKNFKDLIEASKTIYASLKYNGPKNNKTKIVTSKFAFASVVSIKKFKKRRKVFKKYLGKKTRDGEIPAKIFSQFLEKDPRLIFQKEFI